MLEMNPDKSPETPNKVYRKGYDPYYWYNLALSVYENVSKSECEDWLRHPCTKALIYQLQANVSSKIVGWLYGRFANEESVDATAQMQAKSIGQVQACDETIDLINEIGKGIFGEEEKDNDSSSRA